MDILVGFSVNPEIRFTFNAESCESKIPLEGASVTLAGSAFNTASALFQLGLKPTLIGLTCFECDPFGAVMNDLFRSIPFTNHLLPVLDSSSLAFLPITGKQNRVIGRRGQIQSSFLEKTIQNIFNIREESRPAICLALGVSRSEIEITRELFQGEDTFNIFVPNKNLLCSSMDLFKDVCSLADFIFMSDYEYEAVKSMQLSVKQIHGYGVQLIVVTENSRGGWFSYLGIRREYSAIKSSECVSEVGAGDWFLAGFLAKLVKDNDDMKSVTIEQIESSLKFASLVAGLKVQYVGASNGPTIEFLKGYVL